MTLAEQRERNYKLSKVIIDHYGVSFFRGKKILDLGSGNGELANIFAKLGASLTCCDARQENLDIIKKKFPHIHTIQADLEKEFPFHNLSFDLILSIDLLCHLKNYDFHLVNMLRATENVVLETEILDSFDPGKIIEIQEMQKLPDLSFSGIGTVISDQHLLDKLVSYGAKGKIINETKLNDGTFKYDWKATNSGRKPGNRRLWFIKKDQHFARIQKLYQEQAEKTETIKFQEIAKLQSSRAATEKKYTYMQIPDTSSKEKKFVIVIASYKNERWCEKNILSALNQKFEKFRIIFTDDCSPDKTFDLVSKVVENHPNRDKCRLIRNEKRVGALKNLYDMIHTCDDLEIVLTLDGDDTLSDDTVLARLQNHYNTSDSWMINTQYANSTEGFGCSSAYPAHVVANNSYRSDTWRASHLRTFYTWVFKQIKKEDLMKDGEFYSMTYDMAICYPLLELCGKKQMFVNEVMYIYNLDNPINDHKVNIKLQQQLDREIRSKIRYLPIRAIPTIEKKIGLFIIATGKYDQFIDQLISSADQFFLTDLKYQVHYYIFTDKIEHKVKTSRNYTIIPVEHRPFPYATMDRFKHFIEAKEKWSQEDLCFYIDVDCRFVSNIGSEIFGELIITKHCGFVNKTGPYETRPESEACVDLQTHTLPYAGGGFFGASKDNFLNLCESCYTAIEKDTAKGIMAIWHDESYLNKYVSKNKPDIILEPSFHYPEGNINYYKKIWGRDYEKKIILLEKNHLEVRGD